MILGNFSKYMTRGLASPPPRYSLMCCPTAELGRVIIFDRSNLVTFKTVNHSRPNASLPSPPDRTSAYIHRHNRYKHHLKRYRTSIVVISVNVELKTEESGRFSMPANSFISLNISEYHGHHNKPQNLHDNQPCPPDSHQCHQNKSPFGANIGHFIHDSRFVQILVCKDSCAPSFASIRTS
jgi:hypothetical protein